MNRSSRAILAMFRSKADVVVVHDPELLIGAIPLALARGRNRVVFDLHENLPAQLATRSASSRWFRGVSSSIAGVVLRMAEKVMTVTLAEPQYEKLFKREHAVFANFPIAESLPIRSDEAAGLVYVGDVTRSRGAMLLMEAASVNSVGPVTLIGRCSDALRRELEAIADRSDIDLRMTGFLPYDDAWSLAAESLVGVSPLMDTPNYRDSLPTKILEYRGVGLITVASDLPGGADVLSDSVVAMTFEAGNAASLAAALEVAMSDPHAPGRALAEVDSVRQKWRWDSDGFTDFYFGLLTADP
jgi:glycosyltransferase involved in cell wall biosynthesis